MNVISARSVLRNKHLATFDLQLQLAHQRLQLFFFHVMRCWWLHGVAVLKSEVFHEHVDMSGIVLLHNSSLSPAQPPVQRFESLR